MNTENTENTGEVQKTSVINETKTRGRKRNPACKRRIYLTRQELGEGKVNYVPRGKGAPAVGKETFYVEVQRSVKNSEFVYNSETMTVFTETVGPRTYKKANVEKVETLTTTTENAPATQETNPVAVAA